MIYKSIHNIKKWLYTGLLTLITFSSGFSQNFTPYTELDRYIKLGLDSNPGLLEEELKYQVSLEQMKQSGILPDPVVSGGIFISPVETRVGPQQAKISVSQMFPWFGTLKAQSLQANLASKAAYFSYLEAANELVYNIKTSWYQLTYVDQQIAIINEQNAILEKLENYMVIRFQNNQAILSDVLDIQMEKEKLENRLNDLQLTRKILISEFYNTLNVRQQDDIITVTSFKEVSLPNFAIDSVFRSNFRLRELEYQQSATEAALQESIQRAKPSIGLGLDYVFVGERNDVSISDNGKDVLMPMISLQLPVFRKKYNADIEEKRLQTNMLQQREQQLKNTLDSRWQKALNNYAIAKNDLELSESLLAKAKKSKEIITTAYETGKKMYEDVLRVQHKLFDYQLMYLQAAYDLTRSVAKLEYLISGDFLVRSEDL